MRTLTFPSPAHRQPLLGSHGEGPSPHSPWTRAGLGLPRDVHQQGRLERRQRPISTIKEQPGNPRPERESAPAKVTAGAGTPYHAPRSHQSSLMKKPRVAGILAPNLGYPEYHPLEKNSGSAPSNQRSPRPASVPQPVHRLLTQAEEEQPQGQGGPRAVPHVSAGG